MSLFDSNIYAFGACRPIGRYCNTFTVYWSNHLIANIVFLVYTWQYFIIKLCGVFTFHCGVYQLKLLQTYFNMLYGKVRYCIFNAWNKFDRTCLLIVSSFILKPCSGSKIWKNILPPKTYILTIWKWPWN